MKFIIMLSLFPAILLAPSLPVQEVGPDKVVKAQTEEYAKRAKEVKDNDAEGHFNLGLWCMKNGLAPFPPAREEFEKVVAIDPDHEEAQKILGWKKEEGKWVKDYSAMAKQIKIVTDYPDDHEFVKFLRDPANWENILKSIDDRIGLYRFPGEMEITCHFNRDGTMPGLARLSEYGLEGKPYKYSIFITAPVQAVVIHELCHGLTWPACFSAPAWPRWAYEGLPAYAANQHYRVKEIKNLTKIDEGEYPGWSLYGRGFLFYKYFEDAYGVDKLKEIIRLAIIKRKPLKEAIKTVTGLDWEACREAEYEHAKKYMSNLEKK